MIIAKSPLRLSLGGGGTDIPSYFKKNGGEWYSIAINRYIYTSVNKRFSEKSLLKYSEIEELEDLSLSKHRLLSSIFKRFPLFKGIEFTSTADIPSGTGLGSSGAFTVSTLLSLRSFLNFQIDKMDLAKEACDIEINDLNSSSGLQDQYISSLGGLKNFKVDKKGTVSYQNIELPHDINDFFTNHVVLVYTNISRSSEIGLNSFVSKLQKNKKVQTVDQKYVPSFKSYVDALLKKDYEELGLLLHSYWTIKKKSVPYMSNDFIDLLYENLQKNGVIGGKLIGAGGGGFFMCITNQLEKLKTFCNKNNIYYMQVLPDDKGASLIEKI